MKITYYIAPDRKIYASTFWSPTICSAADSFRSNSAAWLHVGEIDESGNLLYFHGSADHREALQESAPLMVGETYRMELAPIGTHAESEWRRLALQFDGHRMKALWHLKAMMQDPAKHASIVEEFLAAPPLDGEAVLAERIKALAGGVSSRGQAVQQATLDVLADLKQHIAATKPFTLVPMHRHGVYDRYEGTLATLPGELLVTMGLTLVDSDSAYLTFDVGSLHEAGDPVEYPISRAAADQILAACLEKP